MRFFRHGLALSVLVLLSVPAARPGRADIRDDFLGYGPLEGSETQGKFLLGAGLDDLPGADGTRHIAVLARGVDAAGKPATVALHGRGALRTVDGAGRVHVGIDPWFAGLRLPAPGGGEIELGAGQLVDGLTWYGLRHRRAPGAAWTMPCGPDGRALAVAGHFTRRGGHEGGDAISFSCADGVVAKCAGWGYLPGVDPASVDWRAHLACTRMARADDCADGTSHTRTGTYIQIHDVVGVRSPPLRPWPELATWPPPPHVFYFEAAWRADAPALCLSKPRWQSLPVGPRCGGLLPDPRQDPSAKYCEHQDVNALVAQGALVFNTSFYADIGLSLWSNGADAVTTVRGFHAEPGTSEPAVIPFDGYRHLDTVATLLRHPPAGFPPGDLVPVSMHVGPGGDHVLVPGASPPAGFTPLTGEVAWEGFLLASPRVGTVPFRLYVGPTGDLLSSTQAPSGYVEQRLLGHAIAAP